MVAAEDRDITLFEPRNDRRVEPGILAGAAARIGSELLPIGPDTGADEKRVPRADLDPRLFFPGFNIFNVDWRSRLEIRHAFQARYVNEDPARQNAVLHVGDRVLRMAVLLCNGSRIRLI